MTPPLVKNLSKEKMKMDDRVFGVGNRLTFKYKDIILKESASDGIREKNEGVKTPEKNTEKSVNNGEEKTELKEEENNRRRMRRVILT